MIKALSEFAYRVSMWWHPTPQKRLAEAVRLATDEIVFHVAFALQTVAKQNVANHGFQSESTAAFDRIGRSADEILTSR